MAPHACAAGGHGFSRRGPRKPFAVRAVPIPLVIRSTPAVVVLPDWPPRTNHELVAKTELDSAPDHPEDEVGRIDRYLAHHAYAWSSTTDVLESDGEKDYSARMSQARTS